MALGACRISFLIAVVSSAEHIPDVACQSDGPGGAAALLQRSGRRGSVHEQQEEASEKSLKVDLGKAGNQDDTESVAAKDAREDDGGEASFESMESKRVSRLMTDDEESDGVQFQESGAEVEDESMTAEDAEEDDGPEALPEEGVSTGEAENDEADVLEEQESSEAKGCPSWPADHFRCTSSHQFLGQFRITLHSKGTDVKDYMCWCPWAWEAAKWLDALPENQKKSERNSCPIRGFKFLTGICKRKGVFP